MKHTSMKRAKATHLTWTGPDALIHRLEWRTDGNMNSWLTPACYMRGMINADDDHVHDDDRALTCLECIGKMS